MQISPVKPFRSPQSALNTGAASLANRPAASPQTVRFGDITTPQLVSGAFLLGLAVLGALKGWLDFKPTPEPGSDHPEVREAIALAAEAKMREVEATKGATDFPSGTPPTTL